MKPQTFKLHLRVFKLLHPILDVLLGGGVAGVCGKNDDDIVTPTPRTTSPEEPFYSVFTVLS